MAADHEPSLDASLAVQGDQGRITVTNPLSPHTGHELQVKTAAGETSEVVDGQSTYAHQLEHVVDLIAGDTRPITGGKDAVGNMRLIDAIYSAAGMLPRGVSD